MKVAIMQPYFFPYLGYWQLIEMVDVFVVYDDVNYIKQGYVNRNKILSVTGPQRITLEVLGASSNKNINDIYVGKNRRKLLKTLIQSYRNSPFFETLYPIIEDILLNSEKDLSKFLYYSLDKLSKYMGIQTKIVFSSSIDNDNDKVLRGQDKVIDLCKTLNASDYINAIGGTELYDKKKFLEEGIKLSFLSPDLGEYLQFNNLFQPNLSIIDVLMFNSKNKTRTMLGNYDLL